MAKQLEDLLESLKTNHTSLKDVEKVLSLLGWIRRAAGKEASVWRKGSRTLTLPRPKGGRFLKPKYVSLVRREIRAAEEEARDLNGRED